MEYEIIENSDSIKVSLEGREFLQVLRKSTWTAELVSKFYKDDTLILESSFSVILFSRRMTINYQNLGENIVVSKKRGKYLLYCRRNLFRNDRSHFKNPIYLLYKNEQVFGEVYSIPFGISLPPFKYKVMYKKEEEDNFYSLLFFLMELTSF
jgi:hypothetical protein